MSRELVVKIDLKTLTIGLAIALLGVVSVQTIGPAKAATSLTGQYGCITNKNFSGFSSWATWQSGDSTTNITGNNYLTTLLLQEGMGASASGEPNTGMCNKV